MASLRAFLPSAGGTVWRNDRRLTSTSSSCEGEYSLSRTRIKHIVIREVWKKNVPSPHAVYKIDVMTQSNHWFILRRYSEFHSLHQNLVKHFGIPIDMLPSKKFSSNMSLGHLENRRNALEHYLQRLINSHCDIAESKELFQFLNVETHDVLCVTRQLATVLEKEGRNILVSGSMFTFTPTQMYCITRQLQLPHFAGEPTDTSTEDEELTDLGYLYGFIQELKSLCVSGLARRSSPCRELVSNQAFDISLFKSLQKLQIEKCHICVIEGLFRIQKQLTHVTLNNSLKTMKEFLVDCAMQKRPMNQANCNVESWRNVSTTRLTENRVVVRPWLLLTHVNMSHNKIPTLDHSLKLLPALEQLDLSYNEFVHLDLKQLTSSTLTFLNISHNNIHYISATTKDLRNLKSFLLSHNKLQNLDGLDCLRGLVELDVRNNELKRIEELAKISSLLHMRILALTGNPLASPKSHRIQVFSQLKSRELILDGIKITENEKAKVNQAKVNPKPSDFTAAQHKTVDLKEKIPETDRDDDQDSGFGGNYGGSVDDGNLMFDWNFYGDGVQVPVSLKHSRNIHVAGPSGQRQEQREPTIQLKQSNFVPRRDFNPSNIGTQPSLNDGRIDKGKSPLKVKRLWPRNETPLKFPTTEKCQQENVQCDKPGMERDYMGSIRSVEGRLSDVESENYCSNFEPTDELTTSQENCCKNNSEQIGKLPLGNQSVTNKNSICEKVKNDAQIGEQSEVVACDVSRNPSVVDDSLLSTVYSENSLVKTEDPSPDADCDPSKVYDKKKKSLIKESLVSTETECSVVPGQSLPNDFQSSQDQASSLAEGGDDENKSSSVVKDCLPSFIPDCSVKLCSVAEKSSNNMNDVNKLSFSLDEARFPSAVVSETIKTTIGECSSSTVDIDRGGINYLPVGLSSAITVCNTNTESSATERGSSTNLYVVDANVCTDSERSSSELVNTDINVSSAQIENERVESTSSTLCEDYDNFCSLAYENSSNDIKDIT